LKKSLYSCINLFVANEMLKNILICQDTDEDLLDTGSLFFNVNKCCNSFFFYFLLNFTVDLVQTGKEAKESDIKPFWMKHLLESAVLWLQLFNDVSLSVRVVWEQKYKRLFLRLTFRKSRSHPELHYLFRSKTR
jgi:hypothetical protein